MRLTRRSAGEGAGVWMHTHDRFVVSGTSRLTVEVVRRLASRGATVMVLDAQGDGALAQRLGDQALVHGRLGLRALRAVARDWRSDRRGRIRVVSGGEDLKESLGRAGLPSATCLLALADDDEENLLVALAGGEVAPRVPVVIQTFDPALADQLEQVEREVKVRRAYSVGGLSAPFFVALACGDENIRTMRFGDQGTDVRWKQLSGWIAGKGAQ